MNRFLVIDDEENRFELYKNLFSFIEIEYLESIDDLSIYIDKNFDGYIIDIKLDVNNNSSNISYMGASFKSVIDSIPSNKPIFLISQRWREVMNGTEMSSLVKSEKYKNVLGYFSWDIIEGNNIALYQEFARTQLKNFEGIRNHNISENDDFTLLQISDLEFGNADQYDYLKSERNQIIANIREDLMLLNINKQKVDAIVICGDIAHKGLIDEYNKAIEWIKIFSEQVLRGDIQDGFILVPGNHDFCIDSTLQNYYYYDFKLKKIIERETPINDYSYLGLQNYLNFEYQITGNSKKLLNPKHYYINNTFKDLNIIFIEIHPIQYNPINKSFEYILTDDDFSEIEKELFGIQSDVTCILVSHVPYEAINLGDKTAPVIKNELQNFIERTDIKVWMNGHSHSGCVIDDIKFGKKKRLLSRSDALLIKPLGRCDGSPGGYNLMNFKRENGKIVAVEYIEDGKVETKYSPFE